jgi:hypothetical protein
MHAILTALVAVGLFGYGASKAFDHNKAGAPLIETRNACDQATDDAYDMIRDTSWPDDVQARIEAADDVGEMCWAIGEPDETCEAMVKACALPPIRYTRGAK